MLAKINKVLPSGYKVFLNRRCYKTEVLFVPKRNDNLTFEVGTGVRIMEDGRMLPVDIEHCHRCHVIREITHAQQFCDCYDDKEVLSESVIITSKTYKKYTQNFGYKISARLSDSEGDDKMIKIHFVQFEQSALFDLASDLIVGRTYFIKGVVNPTVARGPRINILLNVFHIQLCDFQI